MGSKIVINHAISGRLRLTVPALGRIRDHAFVAQAFEAMAGIKNVRLVPLIQSLIIEYDPKHLGQNQVMQFVSIFFNPSKKVSQSTVESVKREMRGSVIRSAVSGSLLLIAFLRNRRGGSLDLLDYAAVASAAYTALSHGENNLNHPDVLIAILSLLSLGPSNILRAAVITWAFNLIEIINDFRRQPYALGY
ncbi:MAG: hypothetical protein FWF59_03485 [Turicibacter sp.]|nr:hypothetical protein [Turicibacter sp.]